jgi:hypothetical protein
VFATLTTAAARSLSTFDGTFTPHRFATLRVNEEDVMRDNPLYGVTIGSTAFAADGSFGASVIEGRITKMISQEEAVKVMTGESSYVQQGSLNQGSLGVTGSYGVSGVSKVKAAVAGYVGNARVTSGESVEVHYNVQISAGVEYVNFNGLEVTGLMLALAGGPQQLAFESLEFYLKLLDELKPLTNKECDLECALFKVIRQPEDARYAAAHVCLKRWLVSVDRFAAAFGDGLVVGIIWGGIGTVTTRMTTALGASTWKYGGSAAFSYSGVGSSVSVEATYDGSQSVAHGAVEVETTNNSIGNCVYALVGDWFSKVSDKSFEQLAKVHVMDTLPSIKGSVTPPAAPEFVTPVPVGEKEESIASKIGGIKDLNGLQALAKASAYDEAKKTDKTLTLDAFLKGAKQEANTDALTKSAVKVRDNSFSVLEGQKQTAPPMPPPRAATDNTAAQSPGDSGYAPLGVWIADWATLFPWLANGFCNDIRNDDATDGMLKQRMMVQDFQTLRKTYAMVEACRFNMFPFNASTARQISDSFGGQLPALQRGVGVHDAFEMLNDDAKTIYKKWDELKFLRNCELGMGVVVGGTQSMTDKRGGMPGFYTSFELGRIQFGGANYSAFASFLKVFPMIAPDGTLCVFGPANKFLCDVSDGACNFSDGTFSPMALEANMTEMILENKAAGLKLYPIPFTAADGIAWKGQSLSTNLAAMGALQNQLATVGKDLKGRKSWTFSSEAWERDYPGWKGNTHYATKLIKPQYIGLIAERRNIFS